MAGKSPMAAYLEGNESWPDVTLAPEKTDRAAM